MWARYDAAVVREILRTLGADGSEREGGEVSIVVSEHFERVLPFTESSLRSDAGEGEAPAPLAPDPSVAANEGRDPSA